FFFGASVLGYMVGSFGNRRLLRDGMQSETLLRLGLVILIAAARAILVVAAKIWGGVAGIMGPYVVYCFAISLVQSNAIAAAMEPVTHMAGPGASVVGGKHERHAACR